jgi:hypothetical protein
MISSLRLSVNPEEYGSAPNFAGDLVTRLPWVNEILVTGAGKYNIEIHYNTCLRLDINQGL